MAYDTSKDVELEREELKRGHYKLVVSLHSYDKGPTKLQLSRVNLSEERETFVKLGRLPKDDVEELLLLIKKILPRMDETLETQEILK